jgi:rod shape-determining protein MreB
MRGEGIIIRSPSAVAIDKDTREIIAQGREAKEMMGKTPMGILAFRPLKDGVITDADVTAGMLRNYFRHIGAISTFSRPLVVASVPYGVTEVEKRAIEDAAFEAGARRVALMEEPVAAALGAGIDIFSPTGKMIIDIGGGTTDVAVISLGGVVVSKSIKVAGNKFDAAIMKYMRRKYNVIIGERTAELVKMKIGAVYEHPVAKEYDVKGRCLLQGLPKVVKVSSKEMLEAMMEPITEVLDAIYAVIENTPPELIGDILKGGIVMTGGSSLLYGLDKLIEELTGIKTRVAERPELCVVKGTGEALKYLSGQSDGILDLSKAKTKTKGAKK